jgi:hypothetical protein
VPTRCRPADHPCCLLLPRNTIVIFSTLP